MRQFIASTQIDSNGLLTITGKDYRYLKQVLRIKNGDMVSVRIPDGSLVNMTAANVDTNLRVLTLQLCDISASSENSLTDHLPEASSTMDDNGVKLWLFQFIAKPQKMDLIIRQAVECGVSTIVPVIGEYCQQGSIKSCASNRDDRWTRIIREARSQSGSAIDTQVLEAVTVSEAIELWQKHKSNNSLAVALYERIDGTKLIHEACKMEELPDIAAVAVGAEGGISPQEIKMMQDAGFVPVHFITNILRCETAALYGLASLQSALMEKKVWRYRE